MFTDREAVTGAEFHSCWKMELSLSESECQTMPSTTAEISCQVGDTVEADCQTEDGKNGQMSFDRSILLLLQDPRVVIISLMKLL